MKRPPDSPFAAEYELENRERLNRLFNASPLGDNLVDHLPLYMSRKSLMRLLFFKELYDRILDVHGVIMEFGCKWGKNLSLFTALRGIYEPYNHNRRVIGFDTFEGLAGVGSKDGEFRHVENGAYATTENYDQHLREVLACLEAESPISHIQKFEVVRGDVRVTLPNYLADNPQTVVALAYLDMDIYEPTKVALSSLLPHLTVGSIIGFDEMNWNSFPGPTLALKEVFGLGRFKIHRSPLQPIPGWIEITG